MLSDAVRRAILDKCAGVPCVRTLGLNVLEFDEGYCKLTATYDPAFNGTRPGVHGGILATIADCAAWFAIVTVTGPEEPLTTCDLNIRYLTPCLTDVTAVARLVKHGRTLCPASVELYDADGAHVAAAQVTYFRLQSNTHEHSQA